MTDQTKTPAADDDKKPAKAAKADPAAASIATARSWIESGEVSAEKAAEWLQANCPDSFKDVAAASAAISQ